MLCTSQELSKEQLRDENIIPVTKRAERPHYQDYDVKPTELYQAIEAKEWDFALVKLKEDPEQASVWIIRKESNNTEKIRWKMLPMHAAVIFKAPAKLIKALIAAFPPCIKMVDDIGMTPLHHGMKEGMDDEVMDILISNHPHALIDRDTKGMTPLDHTKSSAKPFRGAGLRAYTAAAVMCERERVTDELTKKYQAAINNSEADKKITALANENEVLEGQLNASTAHLAKFMQTYGAMKSRVESLSSVLSIMVQEQDKILSMATQQQKDMAAAALVRERMMQAVAKQDDEMMSTAQQSRDVMKDIATKQKEYFQTVATDLAELFASQALRTKRTPTAEGSGKEIG